MPASKPTETAKKSWAEEAKRLGAAFRANKCVVRDFTQFESTKKSAHLNYAILVFSGNEKTLRLKIRPREGRGRNYYLISNLIQGAGSCGILSDERFSKTSFCRALFVLGDPFLEVIKRHNNWDFEPTAHEKLEWSTQFKELVDVL